MITKIKTYLKGKNPYLLGFAAIVLLSIGLIVWILLGETAEKPDEIQNTIYKVEETGEPEDVETETGPESLPDSEVETSENISESEKLQEETLEPIETKPDLEIGSAEGVEQELPPATEQLVVQKPEETEKPVKEPVSGSKVEVTPKPIPEDTPTPERAPEATPAPTPEPEQDREPEAEDASGVVPEEHVHSWIFESWYQEPTCSNGGLACQICASCGETQITQGTPTGKHDCVVESAGDCCSEEIRICLECNHRITGNKDMTNHFDVEDGFCYGCGQKTKQSLEGGA